MKIETKLKVGDTFWFYHNGKAVETSVHMIDVRVEKDEKVTVKYWASINDKFEIIVDSLSFATKEDLLKSL